MSLRATFVLMVLFLVLGTFAIFDPLRTREKEEEKREHDAHVVWLKDKKLTGLTLKTSKGTVELECVSKEKACAFDSSGDWFLAQPVQDNGDPATIGTLAASLLNLIQNERIALEAEPDLKEYGLEKPQVEVTLRLAGEKAPITLKFGKASPVSPNVFLTASTEARTVFLVPNYLPGMFTKELFHWRNKRLFPAVGSAEISAISWKDAKKVEIRAVKDQKAWRLERPFPAAAGKVMFEGLANSLAFAAAKSIYSPSEANPVPAKALPGKPELELEFVTPKGVQKLKLFPKAAAKPGAPKELLARVNDSLVVYQVEPNQFERFGKPLLEYRSRTILDDVSRELADELRFTFPRSHEDVVVRRTGTTWSYFPASTNLPPLSASVIVALLNGLRDSAYQAFFPLNGPSKEAVAFRSQTPDVKLEVKSGGNLLAMASFTVFERKVALTESEGDVRTLPETFLKVLPVKLVDLSQLANKMVVVKPEEGKGDGHSH